MCHWIQRIWDLGYSRSNPLGSVNFALNCKILFKIYVNMSLFYIRIKIKKLTSCPLANLTYPGFLIFNWAPSLVRFVPNLV